ncbi:MAG: hypothetical protein JST75_09585 [Bacteroidetes bacterium]|nr:hypothetical protein [Bacteroidota bacterium]
MSKLEQFKKHLKPGEVYRRNDLQAWSSAVDRHLQQLIKDGTLQKLSGGLYYVPKETTFGKAPAEEKELVNAFLKDNRFLVTSPNDYNSLGVGTTQLYNTRRVYNYKRHGNYKLGNRMFQFVRKPYVPANATREFLLVDLVNNIKHLSEDQPALVENIKKKAEKMDKHRLRQLAHNFGTAGTRKILAEVLHQ